MCLSVCTLTTGLPCTPCLHSCPVTHAVYCEWLLDSHFWEAGADCPPPLSAGGGLSGQQPWWQSPSVQHTKCRHSSVKSGWLSHTNLKQVKKPCQHFNQDALAFFRMKIPLHPEKTRTSCMVKTRFKLALNIHPDLQESTKNLAPTYSCVCVYIIFLCIKVLALYVKT